ncbi:hypothetical protein E2C01_040781 [Portunus trituberculatus]|uniref:Uncharacterized protein n=1 Tax=Portunus trituberculatus TaxID=210409 RepID=A0A5B7FNW3_PORTR|nr:hypothetical protein [Portunus trituberculatus]
MNKFFFGSAALLALLGLFVREGETHLRLTVRPMQKRTVIKEDMTVCSRRSRLRRGLAVLSDWEREAREGS